MRGLVPTGRALVGFYIGLVQALEGRPGHLGISRCALSFQRLHELVLPLVMGVQQGGRSLLSPYTSSTAAGSSTACCWPCCWPLSPLPPPSPVRCGPSHGPAGGTGLEVAAARAACPPLCSPLVP